MKVKVCGIADEDSARELQESRVTYLGLIFVPTSPRAVTCEKARALAELAPSKKWIGVFVEESIDVVLNRVAQVGLSGVQLHGNESEGYVAELREKLPRNVDVWKVFPVATRDDLTRAMEFDRTHVSGLLFDTKAPNGLSGGTGQQFDWNLLEGIPTDVPIILSGGIGSGDVLRVKTVVQRYPQMVAIDINSKFEKSPGVKNVQLVREFIEELE
ncbi:MAG: phosphoribosylanthranilate isomerase [Bdellovibrionales bacterium]|nr:phosphoribosylanthranilate isomerase [Bdellovibrionales bacterium]